MSTVLEHIIDCDVAPFNPWEKDGWTVKEHKKGGQWKFDHKQVKLYLHSFQEQGIEGNRLRKELWYKKKSVFNANVLDYLLAHQHLIPDNWKNNTGVNILYIFFSDTVYRRPDGAQYVRCLYWKEVGGWQCTVRCLGFGWFRRDPTAVRVG